MTGYLLDGDRDRAGRRLAIKERLQDPATFEFLTRIGVGEGWRCLELGAGHGSVAEWLCRRVGDGGRVVATDLETDLLAALDHPCLEVRRHDVASDSLEQEAFDLVHARDLLVHVPDREGALTALRRALRPGGSILLEEPDAGTDGPDPSCAPWHRRLYVHVTSGIYAHLRERGLDPVFGRKLVGALRRAGFRETGAEGRVRHFRGSSEGTESPHMMAFADLADDVITSGFVRRADYAAFLDLARQPDFAWREAMTVSAWGRKPEVEPE